MYKLKFVWQHSTLIILSLIACRLSFAASIQKLPDSVVESAECANRQGRCVTQNDLVTDQFEFSC